MIISIEITLFRRIIIKLLRSYYCHRITTTIIKFCKLSSPIWAFVCTQVCGDIKTIVPLCKKYRWQFGMRKERNANCICHTNESPSGPALLKCWAAVSLWRSLSVLSSICWGVGSSKWSVSPLCLKIGGFTYVKWGSCLRNNVEDNCENGFSCLLFFNRILINHMWFVAFLFYYTKLYRIFWSNHFFQLEIHFSLII